MGIVLEWNVIMAFVIGLVVLFIMAKAFSLSLRIIFKLIINVIIGGAALLVINFFGSFIGFNITINVVTAFITGVFGVPGVVLIVILKLLLHI